MTTKKKLKQYLDYKRISIGKFAKNIEVSNDFLRTDGGINTRYLPRICNFLPDLNMDWLLFNKGNMLLSAENELKEVDNYWKDKYYQLLDKYANKQDELQEAKDIIYYTKNKNIKKKM